MSNLPSDIDMLTNAVQTAVVSPTSKSSDDKELSWSNVEDTEDDSPSLNVPVVTAVHNESPASEEKPLVEENVVVEEKSVAEQSVAEQPVVEEPVVDPPVAEQPAPQNAVVPPLIINDDEMPPLVSDESSDDDMPQLVESSDEESSDEETSDDEDMPELVSDNEDDVVHMIIRDSNCSLCRSAIQTLLHHDDGSTNHLEEQSALTRFKHEIPPIITQILWLFITLHAINLVWTVGGCRNSR